MLKMAFLKNIVGFEQEVHIFPEPGGPRLSNTILVTR